tara:strand:- start:7273 stop:7530 length:258 start_codon:yes stop_codon:yes gene_type:complete
MYRNTKSWLEDYNEGKITLTELSRQYDKFVRNHMYCEALEVLPLLSFRSTEWDDVRNDSKIETTKTEMDSIDKMIHSIGHTLIKQ